MRADEALSTAERRRKHMYHIIADHSAEMGLSGWHEICPGTAENMDPYGLVGLIVTYRRERDGLTQREIHRFRLKKRGVEHVVLQEGGAVCLSKTTALKSPREPIPPDVEDAEPKSGGSKPKTTKTSPATKTEAATSRPVHKLISSVAKGLPLDPPGGWIE